MMECKLQTKLVWAVLFVLTFDLSVSQAEYSSNLTLFQNDNKQSATCFGENKSQTSNNNNNTLTNVEDVSKIMIQGSRYFALQLFKTLNKFESKTESNGTIFSPASIWSTLVVAYLGSRGPTEIELGNKLKLRHLPKLTVAMAYQGIKMWSNLKGKMNNATQNTLVSDVNKFFIANNLQINKCFGDLFSSEIETKDFYNKPGQSLLEINDWIKEKTNGKITDLLSSGSITSSTKIIIANAVYFKSAWAQQFDASKTKKNKFYVSPSEEIEVEMMSASSASVLYGVSEELQAAAVEIPYSNPDYSMLIILPHVTKGLESLLHDISTINLQDLLNNLLDDEVNLVIPKFKAEQEFELAGPLYSVGIKKLFDPRYANLSTIFPDENSNSGLALDSVVHKSYINVNEEGTEAAAATALLFARSGRPAFPTQFVANRPFLYLIRDVSTNIILFMGTVRRPYA